MASRWSSVRVDQGRPDRVDLLAGDRQLVRPGIGAGPVDRLGEVGVLVARPDEVDDGVPCQAEQPAPERDAPRLVARQGFQGLDEDQLRQVLRVARAANAAGDVSIDRQVVVVEQATEGPGIPRLGLPHQPLDRGVVEGHNERPGVALGLATHVAPILAADPSRSSSQVGRRHGAIGTSGIAARSVPGPRRKVRSVKPAVAAIA